MRKLVSTRQLILMLLICLATIKVLYLPSLLAKDIGRDAYLFVLFAMLLDFGVLCIFLYLFSKNPNLSFYDILVKMFGVVVAKIIMFLFFVFFMLKCWAVFQSNYSYLNENLYTDLSWVTFSIPILIAVFFIAKVGINPFARLVEFFAPVLIVGFFISFFVGLSKADFTNLLPILEGPILPKIQNFSKYSFWFGDYLIFIVFFGNIKQDEHFNRKVTLSILGGILAFTLFFAISYSIFGYNSICHTNSISDMLQVLPSTSDSGGFDWVLIMIWDITLFLYILLNCLGAFYSFRQVFFKKFPMITISIILIIVLVSSMIFNFDIHLAINFVKDYGTYFCMIVEYFIPLLILIFSFRIKREGEKI